MLIHISIYNSNKLRGSNMSINTHQLLQAYRVLSDAALRASYDREQRYSRKPPRNSYNDNFSYNTYNAGRPSNRRGRQQNRQQNNFNYNDYYPNGGY